MKKYFNPTDANFYLEELKYVYEASDNWPSTLVEVTDEVYTEFTSGKNPTGKMVGSDKKGQPVWVDIPPPTHAEQVAQAEHKKQQLLAEASAQIALMQTVCNPAANPNVTPEQQAKLLAWQQYQVALYLIDPNDAPDIVWPEKPQQ